MYDYIRKDFWLEAADHTALRTRFPDIESLKVAEIKEALASAEGGQEVFGRTEDEVLRKIVNYAVTDRVAQKAHAQDRPKLWKGLVSDLNLHVTHVVHMVEDLVPFGVPFKHAYVLIRFSNGNIDRCDLMPKKGTAHAELRSFLPGIEAEGNVRYNHWINDGRASKSYILDIYTFRMQTPSRLAVEMLRHKLQDTEFKTFNQENNNFQDFVHEVVHFLCHVEEKANKRYNGHSLKFFERHTRLCCRCRQKHS